MFNLSFFVVAGMFQSSLGSQSKNHRLEDFVLKAPRVTFLEDTADWDVRGGGGRGREGGRKKERVSLDENVPQS